MTVVSAHREPTALPSECTLLLCAQKVAIVLKVLSSSLLAHQEPSMSLEDFTTLVNARTAWQVSIALTPA